ncbi:MAG: hypothetical protein R2838_20900 [Caldilineaceae bacterium]
MPMTAEATAHAQPYLNRLDRLLDVLHAGAVAFHTVETDLEWQQMDLADATPIDAQDVGKALIARYKDELLPLLDQPARRAGATRWRSRHGRVDGAQGQVRQGGDAGT